MAHFQHQSSTPHHDSTSVGPFSSDETRLHPSQPRPPQSHPTPHPVYWPICGGLQPAEPVMTQWHPALHPLGPPTPYEATIPPSLNRPTMSPSFYTDSYIPPPPGQQLPHRATSTPGMHPNQLYSYNNADPFVEQYSRHLATYTQPNPPQWTGNGHAYGMPLFSQPLPPPGSYSDINHQPPQSPLVSSSQLAHTVTQPGYSNSGSDQQLPCQQKIPTEKQQEQLYEACRWEGGSSLVISLINRGVDVNSLLNEKLSPLMIASYWGNWSTVKLLLDHGAEVDLQNNEGVTALIEASDEGKMDIVKLLVDRGAKVGLDRALVRACERGENSLILSLINRGADVNKLVEIEYHEGELSMSRHEWSSLIMASYWRKRTTVKLLLDHGAEVDLQTRDGRTALIVASNMGKMGIAKLLLDHGAKVGLDHALVGACDRGDDSLVLSLIIRGVDINCLVRSLVKIRISIFQGRPPQQQCGIPLQRASLKGNKSTVKLLLQHGAQIDIQNNYGETALMSASENGHVKVAQILLNHGAQAELQSNNGRTAINRARSHKMVDLLMLAIIPQLIIMLQPVAHKWRELGKHLGLKKTTLNQCHSSASEEEGHLEAVVNTWSQQNDPRPSWRALIRAVKIIDRDMAKEMDQPLRKQLQTYALNDKEEDSEENDDTEALDEASHLAAVDQAIRQKGELEHSVGHIAFVGPAGSGKSSLMKRLKGEMPSTKSPSTGISEKVIQVEVTKSNSTTVSADLTIWKEISYEDEATRLIYDVESSQFTERPYPLPVTPTATNIPIKIVQTKLPINATTTVTACSSVSVHTKKLNATQIPPSGYVPPRGVFREAIKDRRLKELQEHFKNSWTLYLTDTGGQMEFQEVLPLLVSGPSIFFIIFPLHQDLCQQITIEYRLPDGRRTDPYQSTLTLEEAILQTLTSVASMGTFTYKGSQTKSSPLKPKVLIIGTHKDLLEPATAESKIKEIDSHLQKVIRSTAHYREGLVETYNNSQFIFTVNNFSKDDSDFEKIRSSVAHIIHRGEFEMSYPSTWLIFSLVLRQQMMKDRIISYEQCFAIANDCGIFTNDELNHVLWFLHTKIGLIRHFPTDSLDDIVIRDPQVLFDHITHLLVKTFTHSNLHQYLVDEFQHKGIFTFEDLEIVRQSESLLTPKKFLKLLKHVRIVAPFQTDDGHQKYFMPCALVHSKEIESQQPLTQNSATPPLLITFKCGYCPKGLSGALIVYLLSNEMKSKFEWELQTNRIFRDQVSFCIGDYDIITLKVHPTYLELIHYREQQWENNSDLSVQSVCSSVFQSVVKGVKKVSSEMKLTSDANHSLSFYCQNSDCVKMNGYHPAIFKEDSIILRCRRSGSVKRSPLPINHFFWLKGSNTDVGHDNPSDTPSAGFRVQSKRSESTVGNYCDHSVEIDESDWYDVVDHLKRLNQDQLKRLGAALGLSVFNLDGMKTLPDDMVTAWLRREDHVKRKSGDTLTWSVLADKLKKIGQTGIAEEITKYKHQYCGINRDDDDNVEVDESDWYDVVDYLKRLNEDQLKRLGGALGLSVFNLDGMKTLPDDMVTAWLRREDYVKRKSGDILTWSVLADKLKKIGQTGIAEEIVKDRSSSSNV